MGHLYFQVSYYYVIAFDFIVSFIEELDLFLESIFELNLQLTNFLLFILRG